jgi:hypothetical protein
MELLKSYVRQTATMLDESAVAGRVFFRDFGTLEFEKYLSLRTGESIKKTWFLRIDFKRRDKAARYLFFFGFASAVLRGHCDVTLHLAREEPQGSFKYERLETLSAPNVPSLIEIGYRPGEEKFIARYRDNSTKIGMVHEIGRHFFDEVISMHFST